ncbi:hypothetical protein LXL04_035855 [Taraxacum kok-saghyz]
MKPEDLRRAAAQLKSTQPDEMTEIRAKMIEKASQWLCVILVCLLQVLETYGFYVDITYLESVVEKGAVCLDGSPPAYHWDMGYDTGMDNWLVHIEGGGWCNNVTTCLDRTKTRLGSSKQMAEQVAFSGILHNEQQYNPDFYNWNKIKVRYCDGASFTGDVEKVNPKTNLHFRGARIFHAVIDDLLAKGMSNAENAILSGCSAGGLTSILHCDKFKSLLPKTTNVKCLSDAGYFINSQNVFGKRRLEAFYDDVVKTHGSAKHLPRSCTSKMKSSLCFFPENMVRKVLKPLFLTNAAYDSWQIKNVLAPGIADPHGTWHNCKVDIGRCSSNQIDIIQVLECIRWIFKHEFIKRNVHKLLLCPLPNGNTRNMVNDRFAHVGKQESEKQLGTGFMTGVHSKRLTALTPVIEPATIFAAY